MKAKAAATKRLDTVKVLAPEVGLGVTAAAVPAAVDAAALADPEAADATTGAAAVVAAAAEVTDAAAAELKRYLKELVTI